MNNMPSNNQSFNTQAHLEWLVKTDKTLQTSDGIPIETWELRHDIHNTNILSLWAKHFRNHYCLDANIDKYRTGTGLTREKYLLQQIFPDSSKGLGPSVRSGDFAEILVADFIEYFNKYWVPRLKYDHKSIRNESTKGVDVLGFQMLNEKHHQHDILITIETKAELTGSKPKRNTLYEALQHSEKDLFRQGETLNYLKRRFIDEKKEKESKIIERFQNPIDQPYKTITGAAVIILTEEYDSKILTNVDTSNHPNKENLKVLIIHGHQLMALVHELYKRAADEA